MNTEDTKETERLASASGLFGKKIKIQKGFHLRGDIWKVKKVN